VKLYRLLAVCVVLSGCTVSEIVIDRAKSPDSRWEAELVKGDYGGGATTGFYWSVWIGASGPSGASRWGRKGCTAVVMSGIYGARLRWDSSATLRVLLDPESPPGTIRMNNDCENTGLPVVTVGRAP
jgi:hypothetical protein